MDMFIKMCGIFDPFFIALMGSMLVFFLIFKVLHQLNDAKKLAKTYDTQNFKYITGRILEYEYEEHEKVIEKDGKMVKTTIRRAFPIVEYTYNDETKRYTYKSSYIRQTKENIGYEFPMYIDPKTNEPYIKFDEIYANEIHLTKIITGIVAVLLITLTIVMISCSVYARL